MLVRMWQGEPNSSTTYESGMYVSNERLLHIVYIVQ
jgi:hypothetical protein